MNYRNRKTKMLVCGCLLMLLLGSIFSWSVFKKPLQEAFGWDDSELSWPFTICMICFTLGNIIAARAGKKYPLRIVVWASGLIAFAGLFMASRVTQPWQLCIAYGACMGTAVGMSYNCIVTAGNAWYADKPGTVTGVLMMAFGCGSLIFAPLDNYLLAAVGWSRTFLYLGVVFTAVAALTASYISMPPEDYECRAAEKSAESGEDFTTSEMMHRTSFWLILVWAIAIATIGYSVINQVFMIASSIGLSDVTASLAVSLVSVCNGLGRVISGRVYDRLGGAWEMRSMSVLLILSSGCLIPAIASESPALLFVGMALFGFGFGGGSPTMVNFVRSFYGSRNFSMNYSMLNFNSVAASFISQIISGYVYTVTGSYLSVILCVSVVVAVASVMSLLIKQP